MRQRSRQEPRVPNATLAPSKTTRRRHNYRFIREFIASPFTVGAIAPSSDRLCRKMTEDVDLRGAACVAEFGPGTGVCTDQILPIIPPGCRFFAVELSPRLTQVWKSRHPGATIYNDSVGNIASICRREGIDGIDVVFSGLPWASFKEPLQRELLGATLSVLKPGGKFITFGYRVGTLLPAGRRFARLLPEFFSNIERSDHVWRNLPPAFVIRCTK
jgi:phospholipid N-methyltransferase